MLVKKENNRYSISLAYGDLEDSGLRMEALLATIDVGVYHAGNASYKIDNESGSLYLTIGDKKYRFNPSMRRWEII